MSRMWDEYGGIARFDSRTTVVSDPALANLVLRDASGTYEVNQNFLGQLMSPTQISDTQRVRRLLNPGLRPSALHHTPQHVYKLVRQTLHDSPMMQALDPIEFAEQIIPTAFSWRLFGEGQAPFLREVRALLDALEGVIGNVFALPASWRTPKQRAIEAHHAKLKSDVLAYLSLQADGLSTACPNDAGLVDNLLRQEHRYSDDLLANLIIGALLAAQRVPAAGAAWVLMMLADNPHIQSNLRSEATTFRQLANTQQTAAVAQFPLTLAAVLEALRLYPPTWLITRTTTRDTYLGPYAFQSGHMFMISPYVLHRNPDLYQQPETYDPERWLSSPPAPATFFPFGRGRHKCPGADLATTSLVALVLSLVETYTITRSGTVHPDPRNTLKPQGLTISLEAHTRATQTQPPRPTSR